MVSDKHSEHSIAMVHAMAMDRSRRRWRFFAIICLLLIGFWLSGYLNSNNFKTEPHIAHINIHGMITQNLIQEETLDTLAADKNVKAVIMHIDSPGGTMVGGLSLYHAINRIKLEKPIVAVMGSTAASAGYLISLAVNRTFANEATATGSIGVLIPLVDASDLAAKLGIKANFIASGDLKTAGLPLEKTSEKGQQYLQNMVNDMEDIFISYLTKHRKVTPETLEIIKDGRAIIGKDAQEMNLVDALGGMHEAKNWLHSEYKIAKDIPVIYTELEIEKPLIEEILGEAHILSKKIVNSLSVYGMVSR
jgi:protease-4